MRLTGNDVGPLYAYGLSPTKAILSLEKSKNSVVDPVVSVVRVNDAVRHLVTQSPEPYESQCRRRPDPQNNPAVLSSLMADKDHTWQPGSASGGQGVVQGRAH